MVVDPVAFAVVTVAMPVFHAFHVASAQLAPIAPLLVSNMSEVAELGWEVVHPNVVRSL